MKENHQNVIRKEFAKQAPRFADQRHTLASPIYLEWMVDNLDLQSHFTVLEVAAGTGHLSRAMAPYVKQVIALDATPEMLLEGRHQAERDGLANIVFEEGLAEQLPYPNDAFNMVASRFAIHHFLEPDIPVGEMVRVCRPDGRVAVVDLVSPEDEALAATYNRLERMRDPSHTKALSASEIRKLVKNVGLEIAHTASREVDVNVDRWLELTETTPEVGRTIVEELTQEMKGVKTTGMRPFLRDQELMLRQTWFIILGLKQGVKG